MNTTSALLRSTLQPGDCFVDIGARNGMGATLVAAQLVGPTGRVLALEADYPSFVRLRQNLAFAATAHVTSIHGAIGDDLGARTYRLDDICDQYALPAIKMVRIDTPGFELSALAGMRPLLAGAQVPTLLIEAAQWRQDEGAARRAAIESFCAELGYEVEHLGPIVLARDAEGAMRMRMRLRANRFGWRTLFAGRTAAPACA
jgi:hypothetical protein